MLVVALHRERHRGVVQIIVQAEGNLLRALRLHFRRNGHPQVGRKSYRAGTEQQHTLAHHRVGSFDSEVGQEIVAHREARLG